MVIAAANIAAADIKVRPTGEQRILLRGLSWDAYLQILNALPPTRSAQLTFDDGALEITVPLEEHEFSARLIECFIRTLVELMGLRMKTMGSTTLNYPKLRKGAEPDNAYYIQNHFQVKGRKVDLSQDPPPDLVVEIDITHTDIAKHQFYATLGVPEFWRFDGSTWQIYQLLEGLYQEVETSPTFPSVPKQQLYTFLEQAQEDEIAALQALRAWWQGHS